MLPYCLLQIWAVRVEKLRCFLAMEREQLFIQIRKLRMNVCGRYVTSRGGIPPLGLDAMAIIQDFFRRHVGAPCLQRELSIYSRAPSR